ncbi:MAG: TipAS antibiotic-recognition domain-containing protein [Clostridia bacterium]|nr:TipAS antibiotic-recognition domain-containing protein [Clostridia bacterium]MBN2882832.1 TipAS antibiotic-recognition domain-containing protein [Clostridia bacterium]
MWDVLMKRKSIQHGKTKDIFREFEDKRLQNGHRRWYQTGAGIKKSGSQCKFHQETYVADQRFTENIDVHGKGLASFMSRAMEASLDK